MPTSNLVQAILASEVYREANQSPADIEVENFANLRRIGVRVKTLAHLACLCSA
jgi:hypothetical protein